MAATKQRFRFYETMKLCAAVFIYFFSRLLPRFSFCRKRCELIWSICYRSPVVYHVNTTGSLPPLHNEIIQSRAALTSCPAARSMSVGVYNATSHTFLPAYFIVWRLPAVTYFSFKEGELIPTRAWSASLCLSELRIDFFCPLYHPGIGASAAMFLPIIFCKNN